MPEISEELGLWGLFLSAFISSTLAPGGSEVLLVLLADDLKYSSSSLLLMATVGNTLGALTTWLLGYLLSKGYSVERFTHTPKSKAIDTVRRWGVPVLFFSWLPVVGDAFCLAAGWLRFPFAVSVIVITIGKLARYSVILYAIR